MANKEYNAEDLLLGKYSPFPGDTEVSLLEQGEYVLNRNAVNKIGKKKLDKWNYEDAPRYPDSQDEHRMGRARMMAQEGGFINAGTADLKQKLQQFQQAQMSGSQELANYAKARLYAKGGYVKPYAIGGEVSIPAEDNKMYEDEEERKWKEWSPGPEGATGGEMLPGTGTPPLTQSSVNALYPELGGEKPAVAEPTMAAASPAVAPVSGEPLKSDEDYNLKEVYKSTGAYENSNFDPGDYNPLGKFGEPNWEAKKGAVLSQDTKDKLSPHVQGLKDIGSGLKGALQGFKSGAGKAIGDKLADWKTQREAQDLAANKRGEEVQKWVGEKAGQAKKWIKEDWDKGTDSKIAGGLGFLSMMGQEAINPGSIRQRALEAQMFKDKEGETTEGETTPEVKAIGQTFTDGSENFINKNMLETTLDGREAYNPATKAKLDAAAADSDEMQAEWDKSHAAALAGKDGSIGEYGPGLSKLGKGLYSFAQKIPWWGSKGEQKGGFIHGIGHYQDGGFVDPHNNSRRLMNQARRRYVRSS